MRVELKKVPVSFRPDPELDRVAASPHEEWAHRLASVVYHDVHRARPMVEEAEKDPEWGPLVRQRYKAILEHEHKQHLRAEKGLPREEFPDSSGGNVFSSFLD